MSSELKIELIKIGNLMIEAKLPKPFIAAAVETAFELEGIYDLMSMWAEETDKSEREEIEADIQDLINDCSQKESMGVASFSCFLESLIHQFIAFRYVSLLALISPPDEFTSPFRAT